MLVEKTHQAEVENGEERAASTFIFYKAESGFLSTSLETRAILVYQCPFLLLPEQISTTSVPQNVRYCFSCCSGSQSPSPLLLGCEKECLCCGSSLSECLSSVLGLETATVLGSCLLVLVLKPVAQCLPFFLCLHCSMAFLLHEDLCQQLGYPRQPRIQTSESLILSVRSCCCIRSQ